MHAAQSDLGVDVIRNKRNLGIAAALNQGVQWAKEQGYAWVLTLDQDSVVMPDIVETLSKVYEEFPQKEKLAVIGSNYVDNATRTAFLDGKRDDNCSWQEVQNSHHIGSLVSLFTYRAIGPFREGAFHRLRRF